MPAVIQSRYRCREHPEQSVTHKGTGHAADCWPITGPPH